MNNDIPTALVHHSSSFDFWSHPQVERETGQAPSHDVQNFDDGQFLELGNGHIELDGPFDAVAPSYSIVGFLNPCGASQCTSHNSQTRGLTPVLLQVESSSSELPLTEIHAALPQHSSLPQRVPIPRKSGSRRGQTERRHQETATESSSRKYKPVASNKSNSKGAGPICDERRLACPYFKRNPERYKYSGACAGPGFLTAHRLKEHLFRRHEMPPFYCPCCYVGFKNRAAQDAHIRLADCITRPLEASPEGFDSHQGNKLRSRTFQTGTEKEKWRKMFSILFPDVEPSGIPHPCKFNPHSKVLNLA
jgi:hypothetical protein